MQHDAQVGLITSMVEQLDAGVNLGAGGLRRSQAAASRQRTAESGPVDDHGTSRSKLGLDPFPLLDRIGTG
jgi:hypothetical protein